MRKINQVIHIAATQMNASRHIYAADSNDMKVSTQRQTPTEIEMLYKIKAFIYDDTGAVTVEWVVITAAIIGMGMIFLTPIAFGTSSVTSNLGDKIGTAAVGYGN